MASRTFGIAYTDLTLGLAVVFVLRASQPVSAQGFNEAQEMTKTQNKIKNQVSTFITDSQLKTVIVNVSTSYCNNVPLPQITNSKHFIPFIHSFTLYTYHIQTQ